MNRVVNSIAGRLSLRPPQRQSLEALARVTQIAPVLPRRDGTASGKTIDLGAALTTIRSEFPSVTDFEREFPSLCFALATGVGKTRLMGAFIAYLHQAHAVDNFLLLAPNLTIYNKLIADFTPNTPKYVFRGIAEFAVTPPDLITGDTYENQAPQFGGLTSCRINIFNIGKIASEVRGGKELRMRRLSEFIGQSYFEYLAGLPDLVLLMDESHRYRASAGVKAINELRPVLGLELTATPFVQTGQKTTPFRNVVLEYPLARAMEDGFVKEPAVVTRKDFSTVGMTPEAIERIKLEDGIRLHESIKVELETYARETANPIVKPFVLVIAKDVAHASALKALIESMDFFEGRYAGKVIQVDASRSGAEEEEIIGRLLKVEHADEPTEIVIHVFMLKEGWDVTNLYTIVPLSAANSRTLVEQSIGRGLRLPYGRRTGVGPVDRLNIVAHDRFQEIVDEANRPDSAMRLKQLVLDPSDLVTRPVTVVSQPTVLATLGLATAATQPQGTTPAPAPIFTTPQERRVAQITLDVITELQRSPDVVPTASQLGSAEVQAVIHARVVDRYRSPQGELEGITTAPDIVSVVERTTSEVVKGTIGIPRIVVVPKDRLRARFTPFTLDLSRVNYPPVDDALFLKMLRTNESLVLQMGRGNADEARLEDYVVRALVEYDDVDYGEHADLLYDLAGQVVRRVRSYLGADDKVRNVLVAHERQIGALVHAQMMAHYEEEAAEYETVVTAGYTPLRPRAYAVREGAPLSLSQPPDTKRDISTVVYGGFVRCLYPTEKFESDTERVMAVILDRDSDRWFRPARDQFQITYELGHTHIPYQPDFVAEREHDVLMIETKARKDMASTEVLAKARAARKYCEEASRYGAKHKERPWRYILVPHDEVAENRSLGYLADRFAQDS